MAKKKRKFKMIILFIVFEIVFTVITSIIYVYKGPFNNLKKVVVATIMGTQHQYFATAFLSQNDIKSIMGNNSSKNVEKIDVSKVKINTKKNNEIIRYDIHPDSGRYDGYLLEIPPTYKVKVAWTNKLGVVGQRTSEMAKEHNAIAAINGGAFRDKNKDSYGGAAAFPGRFVISNGNVIYKDKNISDSTPFKVVAFNKSNRLFAGNFSINDLQKMDVSEAVCFDLLGFNAPALIINGKGQIDDASAGDCGFQPRTAIGQKQDGTILFLVMDGRKNLTKSGATLKDVQDELLKHDAFNATILDGGFSSTLYYDGTVINNPHGWNGERYVATAFYVAN